VSILLSPSAQIPTPNQPRRALVAGRAAMIFLGAAAAGVAVAWFPPLALLLCGLAVVVAASRITEALSVLLFWTLPYLILNMPTGAFTLKLPELVAYIFAMAVVVRVVVRRETLALPPATVPVVVFLAVQAISTALSPVVPVPYEGGFSPTDRNNVNFRAASVVIWLGLSWLVVVALHHVVGSRPSLYKRCVRAHILSGTLACVISLVVYALAFRGLQFSIGGQGRSIVYDTGSYLRLSGVSYEPALFAFYILTVLPVTLAVLLVRPGWLPRRVAAFAFIVQVIALVLTFASSGWASVAAALVVLALFLRPTPQQKRRALGLALAGGVVVAALLGLALSNPLIAHILLDPVGKITGGGYAERNDEITAGYAMFHAYPWLGVGPGMAPFFFARFHPAVRNTIMGDVHTVNNLYASTLAENGIIGMVSLICCAAVGLFALLIAIRRQGAVNMPILSALTASLLGTIVHFWSDQILFLVYLAGLLGLATAGERVAGSGVERA